MTITLLDQWRLVLAASGDRRLSACDLSCLVRIVDFYNRNLGRAWPSFDTLARLTGYTRRAVVNSRRQLEDLGYLRVVPGPGRSNNYVPEFELGRPAGPGEPGEPECTAMVSPASPTAPEKVNATAPNTSDFPVASGVGEVEEVFPRSRGASAQRAPSPSREIPDGFQAFFDAYPRKVGIQKAREEFASVVASGVSPDLLREKSAQYSEAKAKTPPHYIKYPGNWLREECYLEDPVPARGTHSERDGGSGRAKGKNKVGIRSVNGKAAKKARGKKSDLCNTLKVNATAKTDVPGASPAKERGNKQCSPRRTPQAVRRRKATRRAAGVATRKRSENPSWQDISLKDKVAAVEADTGLGSDRISEAMGYRPETLEEACRNKGALSHGARKRVHALLDDAIMHHLGGGTVASEWLQDQWRN